MGKDTFDAALIAALKDVKTHPMQFAFVGRTAKDGVLILSKTKIEPKAIETAKKKFGGSAVHTSKHDAFGAGAIAYEAGEGDKFRYHAPSHVTPDLDILAAFKELALEDPDEDWKKAIWPADARNPASQPLAQHEENKPAGQFAGTPTHVPGRSGASTAYTEFVNKLMHPDPQQRLSLTDALQHPFLSDSLMSDEKAREFLKGVKPVQKSN